MITNSSLTVYHKGFDKKDRKETWTRYNYDNIWWFGGKGTSTNMGYDNANDVQIRIPYSLNNNISILNFEIGDILVQGTLNINITKQSDLSSYQVYNITAINNNVFGKETHIHLSGK